MRLKSSIQLMYLSGYQKDVRLQTWIQFPRPWTNMKDNIEEYELQYGDINYREILKNEIVIDIDADYVDCAPAHADLVEKDLNAKRFNYSRWLSGGNGIHFHLLFLPEQIIPIIDKYGYTNVKEKFLHYVIAKKNLNPKNIDSHVCFGHNKLICLEYAKHKKGGQKTLIKDMFSKKLNYYPDILVKELAEEKGIYIKGLEKLKEIQRNSPTNYSLPCEKFITGDNKELLNVFELKDGLYRLMFIYISMLLKKGLDANQIFEKAIIWRKKFNQTWLKNSKHKISDSHIKYMIRSSRGEVGCNFISSALSEIGAKKICDSCILKRK